ncbi:MAG: cell division protein ZapA [Candidatus Kapabacteria bacterium]|nr:cell division protein ZapA [Ignavibacteriota bacterium]MCW5886128.1 cell division protein ZapA [Candidatus Kapabacteria bacterium]
MTQKVHKVIIGGLEYKLTSDNEELLRKAVDIVNAELDELQNQSEVKLPVSQLYVLSALNLAEKLSKLESDVESERIYFRNEIDRITQIIDKSIS